MSSVYQQSWTAGAPYWWNIRIDFFFFFSVQFQRQFSFSVIPVQSGSGALECFFMIISWNAPLFNLEAILYKWNVHKNTSVPPRRTCCNGSLVFWPFYYVKYFSCRMKAVKLWCWGRPEELLVDIIISTFPYIHLPLCMILYSCAVYCPVLLFHSHFHHNWPLSWVVVPLPLLL